MMFTFNHSLVTQMSNLASCSTYQGQRVL